MFDWLMCCCWHPDEPLARLRALRDYEFKGKNGKTVFNYQGYKGAIKAGPVYDGDTMWIAFWDQGEIRQHKIRLEGIDCPEVIPRGQQYPKGPYQTRQDEIDAGVAAKEALEAMIPEDRVGYAEITGRDKWGRLLGFVHFNEGNASKWMLENHYATPMDTNGKPCSLEDLEWL